MNILIAADYTTPQSGNFIASLYELGSEVRRQGGELFFIFPECPNTLRENSWVDWLRHSGYTVCLIRKEQLEAVLLDELEKIIREFRIDILHIHFGLYQDALLRARRKLPVKVLIHDHMALHPSSHMYRQKVKNLLESVAYRVKGFRLASVNAAKNETFVLAKRWHVPNGISMLRNVSMSRTREECRAELGIRADEKVCLFLGWSMYIKGLDIAVKAIAECRKTDPSIVLGVVGVGVPPKENKLNYIREYTDVDPEAPWIRYFPDTEDMYAYHRAADAYLSASRSEGFSYGVLEAISQRTPVVVSDIEGTKWASTYDHAFFYPVEDAQACAEAVHKALAAGREDSNAAEIMETYSINKWCNAVIRIYNSL